MRYCTGEKNVIFFQKNQTDYKEIPVTWNYVQALRNKLLDCNNKNMNELSNEQMGILSGAITFKSSFFVSWIDILQEGLAFLEYLEGSFKIY